MEPSKIEYRVREVTRYIVTRYEEGNDNANRLFASSVSKGEYDCADVAYEVGYALARNEHEALTEAFGWGIGDERIQYPKRPGEENATPVT